uniref:Uncharacterized protein n=1 Tax=Arion vulgaris TaxID=1028688 RepID=A0A0B7BDH1_9EUPU
MECLYHVKRFRSLSLKLSEKCKTNTADDNTGLQCDNTGLQSGSSVTTDVKTNYVM